MQDGETALEQASMKGHQKVVESLLRAGANPDLQDKVRKRQEGCVLAKRSNDVATLSIFVKTASFVKSLVNALLHQTPVLSLVVHILCKHIPSLGKPEPHTRVHSLCMYIICLLQLFYYPIFHATAWICYIQTSDHLCSQCKQSQIIF